MGSSSGRWWTAAEPVCGYLSRAQAVPIIEAFAILI
jgi:hypothetical protein